VFLRDGDTVYRTWHTNGRGTEQLSHSFALIDLLPYGRQEEWQDSPEDWPQSPTYSRWPAPKILPRSTARMCEAADFPDSYRQQRARLCCSLGWPEGEVPSARRRRMIMAKQRGARVAGRPVRAMILAVTGSDR
jgi:hypothetical protein